MRSERLEIALAVLIAIPLTIGSVLFFLGGWIATLLGFGAPAN